MCKLFAEYLAGYALDWFSKSEERSIDSFTQLSTAFVKNHSMFMKNVTSDADLLGVIHHPKDQNRAHEVTSPGCRCPTTSLMYLHIRGRMCIIKISKGKYGYPK